MMVITFIKRLEDNDYALVKQSTTNNLPVPFIGSKVVVEREIYTVGDVEYNYDNGIILIKLI